MDKIALVFPGQGSQYAGMGKNLYETYPYVEKIYDEASDILGIDIKRLCFEPSEDELFYTKNAQIAVFVTSIAAYHVYMEEVGLKPAFLAGHSLGEYNALACGGYLEYHEALKLVDRRGTIMQEALSNKMGVMYAVKDVGEATIKHICGNISRDNHIVMISNYNSENQTIISGHEKAVVTAVEELERLGAKTTLLKTKQPFHSLLVKEAAELFNKELVKYNWKDGRIPVISNVTASVYKYKEDMLKGLSKHMISPVKWKDSMMLLKEYDVSAIIELGPKNVLTNLAKENCPDIPSYSIERDFDKLLKATITFKETLNNDKNNKLSFMSMCICHAICTRNSNYDEDEYKKGMIEPYRKVKELLERLEQQEEEPSMEHVMQAANMLKSVFETKKVPKEERIERYHDILNESNIEGYLRDFSIY